ncbi:MAG: sulfate reduction electron transfer complex DsrMKJOP subunit DsrP [Planctomycetota bacterium]|jgi:molybdopterin-containing oxidoreductase family membrane subunit
MKSVARFLWQGTGAALDGGWRYHLWLLALVLLSLVGLNAYCRQLVHGLVVTGMTDHVSWGLSIGNFTFLVGMAAAAVMLVIPVYIYRREELQGLVLLGELLAVAVIVMCILFVTADLGRPFRMFNLLRGFHFPDSMLSWDIVVLNTYLVLNLFISGYLLFNIWRGTQPARWLYIPFVFIAIVWAFSIHTVTAFLYVGMVSRPFWHSAIIAPRFLASAFSAGPAFMVLTLTVIRRFHGQEFSEKAVDLLRNIITVALTINVFLLGCELFTEFYSESGHVASARYLYFGLHGRHGLTGWIWTAVGMNLIALILLYLPGSRKKRLLNLACVLMIAGIWMEKGMGLIVPGFIPTPLGEIVEYTPTPTEIWINVGIWAFGFLLYTLFVKFALAVTTGSVREKNLEAPARETSAPVPDSV